MKSAMLVRRCSRAMRTILRSTSQASAMASVGPR
jgi:hypothetical protein